MPTSAPLRRTLRTVPTFQFLPGRELDAVAACFICKAYRPGDKLWRAGTRLDFMGIIQKGEIVVEYRRDGMVRRSARLAAGSFFQPSGLSTEDCLSSVSAYAETEVSLCVLRLEQLAGLRAQCPTLDAILTPTPQDRARHLIWSKLWAIITMILIASFVWRDVASALSGILYLTSDRLLLSSDYQTALRLLDRAVWFDPQATYVYNKEGYIWAQMGEEQRAAAAFAQALNIDDTSGPALNNLAIIYFGSGFLDRATALQQRASQADPNIAVIWYNLGLMLIEQNDYPRIIHAFKEATRIDPDWALPNIHLSFVYLQMEDFFKAEQAARTAIRLDPTQQSAHLTLAMALYYQHKTQEALSSIEHAIEMVPDDVVSRFYQALILHDLGEHDRALLILQQLFDLSTDPEQRARIAMEIESILRHSSATLSNSQ